MVEVGTKQGRHAGSTDMPTLIANTFAITTHTANIHNKTGGMHN